MFESDDYDQILSQIDFPEIGVNSIKNNQEPKQNTDHSQKNKIEQNIININQSPLVHAQNVKSSRIDIKNSYSVIQNGICDTSKNIVPKESNVSPKCTKRKIINSYFDHKSKRKFPGPAGLLSGNFEEKKYDDVCQMELLSQDIDFTQSYLNGNIFETPLWKRLVEDTTTLKDVNTIKTIKHQALVGNLQRRKAQFVVAFVESVDRSAIDPLITLRDKTGNIKCTLHRDAWTAFSTYIVSEYCALILSKPTVLTTGSAFKKHYLNITLSNISVIYSSAIVSDGETLPDGCQKICEEDFTIIKINKSDNISRDTIQNDIDLLDDLDIVFSDDMF